MRIIRNENSDWTFHKEGDGIKSIVSIPHTWNIPDATGVGKGYDRTRAWYSKSIHIETEYAEKKIYLEFGAAGTQAQVYVDDTAVPYAKYDIYNNGNEIEYTHKGGFSAFRFDITDYVTPGEDNVVAVMVSNEIDPEIAPIRGDFNLMGGLYRYVKLIVTDEVHIDMADYGSCGMYLKTEKKAAADDFTLTLSSKLVNESNKAQTVEISAQLMEPSSFEVPYNEYIKKHLRFNPKDMYREGGYIKAEFPSEKLILDAGESFEYNKIIDVVAPHLWDGLDFPYRYEVKLTVKVDGEEVDEITENVGFRYFDMPNPKRDENGNITGGKFYLNGREYVLRGAGKHQDWGRGIDALGYAVTDKERLWDAGIMYELGMNSVRLVHYQHSNEEIELYDKLGILVWSEVGIVGNIISAKSDKYRNFLNICKAQLTEMIKQQYNHPSVFTWGLGNEISREVESDLEERMEWCDVPTGERFQAELNDTAKTLDASRSTTYAAFSRYGRKIDWDSDTIGMNLYPYWYDHADVLHGGNVGMGNQVKYHFDIPDKEGKTKPIGVTEYGGSAVIGHTAPFEKDGSVIHPGMDSITTTYQAYVHEKVYSEIINELPFIWCSYIWQLFDSSSDKQKNRLLAGTNDKGLVQYDHKTKKDAFYFYKANWNSFEPFVHIVLKL